MDKLQYFPVKISRRVLGLRSLPSPTKSSHATFCNSKGQTREGKQTWFYFCIIDMTTTLTQLKSQISDEVSIGQIRSQTRSKTGLRLEDKCPCWVKGPTRTSVSVFYIYLPVEVLHSYSGNGLYQMHPVLLTPLSHKSTKQGHQTFREPHSALGADPWKLDPLCQPVDNVSILREPIPIKNIEPKLFSLPDQQNNLGC